MKALLIAPLILIAATSAFAANPAALSPAQAACDEQLGDFHRDGAKVSCDLDGVIYEGRQELQAQAAPLRPLRDERERQETASESGSRADKRLHGRAIDRPRP